MSPSHQDEADNCSTTDFPDKICNPTMRDMINAYKVGLPLWLGVGHELMEALTSLPLANGPVE